MFDMQMKMHGVEHGRVRIVLYWHSRAGCAMVKVELGLEELVGLRCSVAPALSASSSQRQQPRLHGATTSLHAYHKPHNIGILDRVQPGSIRPASMTGLGLAVTSRSRCSFSASTRRWLHSINLQHGGNSVRMSPEVVYAYRERAHSRKPCSEFDQA